MNHKAVNYAKALVRTHSKESALRIAKECEAQSQVGQIIYFDEADYYVNQNGHLEYSKNQSGKNDKKLALRLRKNKTFWRDVVIAINKGQATA